MIAVITDIKYRMSLAVIRDLAEADVDIVVCERDDSTTPPLGFYSKYIKSSHMLRGSNYLADLYALCEKICKEEGVKPALLPVGAATLALLAPDEVRAHFAKVCGLWIPDTAQLDTFNSKEEVARLARSLEIPVPRAYAVDDDNIAYPCVVKPICGEKQGITAADRYVIVQNAEEMKKAYSHFMEITEGAPLIQEYLPGGGAGCSVLAENGKVVVSLCHKRIREYPISGGPSACCAAVRDEKMEAYAAKMVDAVGYNGLAMVEFKQDAAGAYRLLEINPRIWGSFPLTRVSKCGMSVNWFALAWNSANPDCAYVPEKLPPYRECKMHFAPSDMMSAVGYLKHGQAGKFFGAVGDFLNPAVRDGLWEKDDKEPGKVYYKALLKK